MLSLNFTSADKGPFLTGEANIMCQRSFKFFVLPLGFFGAKKFSKYFYGCVDLSRDFGGYSTQSDN